MNALDVYLASFDDAWSHAWESVTAALEGVEEQEAYWQAPCYAMEAPEAGWPTPGTIAWHIAHLAHCKRYYTRVLRARAEPSAPEAKERAELQGLAAERAGLLEAHDQQRETIATLGDADFLQLAASKMPLGEFLAMTTRHDAWHASQIALGRRLYRTRQPASEA